MVERVYGSGTLLAEGGRLAAPLPGGDPLPDFREALLLGAALVSLLLSGPGRLAVRLGPQRIGSSVSEDRR